MKVTSNYHWHDFISSYDVPDSELDDNIEAGSQWLKYRGIWYALTDFNRISFRSFFSEDSSLDYWDGHYTGSVWHCVSIRLSEDGERYQIATITR